MVYVHELRCGFDWDEPFFDTFEDAINKLINFECDDEEYHNNCVSLSKEYFNLDYDWASWEIDEVIDWNSRVFGKKSNFIILRIPGKVTLFDKISKKVLFEKSF